MRGPAERDRRAVRAGLAVVAGLLVGGRGVPAWWRWVSDQRAAAGELQAEVARARAEVRGAPARRDSARAWAQRAAVAEARLVAGASTAASGAALAEELGDVAAEVGVHLGPVELRPAQPLGATPPNACGGAAGCPARPAPFVRVSARTEVAGDVRGLASFLAALERPAGRLAVRELAVTQPEPGAPPTRAEALHATLVVEALTATAGAGRGALGTPPVPSGAPDPAR